MYFLCVWHVVCSLLFGVYCCLPFTGDWLCFVVSCSLWVVRCLLRVVCCVRCVECFVYVVVRGLLFDVLCYCILACYRLCDTSCLLFVIPRVCGLLIVGCYLLVVVCWLLLVDCCLWVVGCSLLVVVCCF